MIHLKKIIIGIFAAIVLVVIATNMQVESDVVEIDNHIEPDVIMPTKVSRPGCEETDSCYIPSKITIKVGKSVTWVNHDSAFHSVTSGSYDIPKDDFDSGHMDPYQTFTWTFEQAGVVNYYCTLHPWMYGQVIVEN